MNSFLHYFKRKGNAANNYDDDQYHCLYNDEFEEGNTSLLVNDYLQAPAVPSSSDSNSLGGHSARNNNFDHSYNHNHHRDYDNSSRSINSNDFDPDQSQKGIWKLNKYTLTRSISLTVPVPIFANLPFSASIPSSSQTPTLRIMHILGNVVAIVTLLSFLILVPVITAHAVIYDKERADFAAFYSAGAFVLVTVLMSSKLIYNHLTNWYMPDVQKYVVRILFMVPIYCIQSWLSLRFRSARIYIDTLRDLYEAYVIQSFLYYLMELLGGEDTLTQILQQKDQHYGDHPPFPKWIFPSWTMGYDFMIKCKHGVLQYVVAKIVATLLTAILEPIGLYDDGEFDWRKGYVYVSVVINFSQMYALYCLVKFYHATMYNLQSPVNWRPLGKFLCIKGVVFFTYWQGTTIAVLKNRGIINNIGNWDKDDVANGLQDYLICVEMFCFAVAHAFTYTHEEYLPNRGAGDGSGETRRNGGIEEDVSDDHEGDIEPPLIRTLDTPMGFKDALWSSTVPNETIDDIMLLKRQIGTRDQFSNQSTEVGTLMNVSMMHAESI